MNTMNAIIVLLGVIALSEVLRLYLTHKKTTKKEHFKQKLNGVKKMIYDLEFKIYKTREIREDVRKEYDMMLSRIQGIDEKIKDWKGEEAERKGIEDQRVLAQRDAERFKAQMKQLDEEVEGAKPTNENPEGVLGVVQQIDSMRELEQMLKDHIKSL